MTSTHENNIERLSLGSFKEIVFAFGLLLFVFLTVPSLVLAARSEPFEPFDATSIVWPLPPEPARIAYVSSIHKPADIDADKSLFKRVVKFILGERVENIVKPYGIVKDGMERLIVADTAAGKVHIFDTRKGKYKVISSGRGFNLLSPIGVTVDASDNIYVSDSVEGNVLVFNAKGRYQFSIDGLIRPTGLAVDNNDHILYVVDTGAHKINVYDLRGTYIKSLGGRGDAEGEFNFPTDIFVTARGDIYVTDSMNFRVQKFNNDGRFLLFISSHGDGTGDMGRPKGVAVDSLGYIYVVDAIFDTVQIFNQNGEFLLNFGLRGSGPGEFWLPAGIFIDANSRIYVADSYNGRVQIFDYLGAKDDVLKR